MNLSSLRQFTARTRVSTTISPQIRVLRDGQQILKAYQASNFVQRLRGLHGFPELKGGQALLIRPCRSVHTLAMAYPIDVAYLDRRGIVLKVLTLVPRRGSVCRGAHTVVEMAQGSIQSLSLEAGQTLSMDGETLT